MSNQQPQNDGSYSFGHPAPLKNGDISIKEMFRRWDQQVDKANKLTSSMTRDELIEILHDLDMHDEAVLVGERFSKNTCFWPTVPGASDDAANILKLTVTFKYNNPRA